MRVKLVNLNVLMDEILVLIEFIYRFFFLGIYYLK